MKTLKFPKGLLAPVLAGTKSVTFRLFNFADHHMRSGEVFLGAFEDGSTSLRMRATAETLVSRAGAIDDLIAQMGGFANTNDMIAQMRFLYPDQSFGPMTKLGAIFFEVVEDLCRPFTDEEVA